MSFSAISARPRSPAVISGNHAPAPLSSGSKLNGISSGSSLNISSSNSRINKSVSQPNTPTTTIIPLPNLAGSSSSDIGAGKGNVNGNALKKEKKRKKGWKGYAMQYLDDDGNVIEERPRDETPPEEREANRIKSGGESIKQVLEEATHGEMVNQVPSPGMSAFRLTMPHCFQCFIPLFESFILSTKMNR